MPSVQGDYSETNHGGVASDTEPLPRFLQATQAIEAFYQLQDPDKFDFVETMKQSSSLLGKAQNLEFALSQPELAKAVPGLAEDLYQALGDPSIPAEITAIYQQFYGDQLTQTLGTDNLARQ